MATPSQDRISNNIAEITETANNEFKKAVEQVERAVDDVVETGGKQAQEVMMDFKSALHQSLRDRPIATLAGVAAVAFIIGALWKS